MKFVIALIIVIGLSLGAWQLYQYWLTFQQPPPRAVAAAPPPVEVSGDQLPGLPSNLEWPLQSAEQHGATSLRVFLDEHASQIKDPRLAWIQLDYVVLAGAGDPAEARRVFARVKGRLAPASPVYRRMQELAKTYE